MNSQVIPFLCRSSEEVALNVSNSFFNILSAAVRLVPLSEMKYVDPGRLAENLVMALIKASALRLCTNSACTDLVLRHVKIAAQTL